MADLDIPTEALEAAARAISHVDWVHGWSANAEVSEAQRTEARHALAAAAPHLIAEGRRQRDQELFANSIEPYEPVQDESPALAARLEREVRAKVAAEIRALASLWCMDGTGRHLIDNVVRIAEGGTHG